MMRAPHIAARWRSFLFWNGHCELESGEGGCGRVRVISQKPEAAATTMQRPQTRAPCWSSVRASFNISACASRRASAAKGLPRRLGPHASSIAPRGPRGNPAGPARVPARPPRRYRSHRRSRARRPARRRLQRDFPLSSSGRAVKQREPVGDRAREPARGSRRSTARSPPRIPLRAGSISPPCRRSSTSATSRSSDSRSKRRARALPAPRAVASIRCRNGSEPSRVSGTRRENSGATRVHRLIAGGAAARRTGLRELERDVAGEQVGGGLRGAGSATARRT